MNNLRKNDVDSQVKFTLKNMKRAKLRSPVIDVTVKKDSLLVYVLNFFCPNDNANQENNSDRLRRDNCGAD